jgi:hypothetical protein
MKTQGDPMNMSDTTDPITSEAEVVICGACPHRLDAHDLIGIRFCKATTASGSGRACVCSSEAGLQGLAYDTSNLAR